MKAVVYHRYGMPDQLEWVDIPTPTPKPNEVLIKVAATSINSWDWDLLTGKPKLYRLFFGLFKPSNPIIGSDVAGYVHAVGEQVTQFEVGDEVYGDVSPNNFGAFAEYVCATEDVLAKKPSNMTFEEAAAIPQAGTLALQGLYNEPKLQKGQHVLINGAGGGVGAFAIQIAKSMGAEVTGVDHTQKLESMLALGADRVIDYTLQDFTRNQQQYHLILDNVAQHSLAEYRQSLLAGGTSKIVGGAVSVLLKTALLGRRNKEKKVSILVHRPNSKDLQILSELYEKGSIKPLIDKIFPLKDAAEAMRHYQSGAFKGKIVLKV
ncbi:MAG: NAD(P)-dependent alcohol dehydrogenase [Chitinophagales bacterium]|nr:NAD(P)-dependent alcohol dehydrogenase [Chitinophagales bacterium]